MLIASRGETDSFERPPVTEAALLIRGIDCLFSEVENSKTVIKTSLLKQEMLVALKKTVVSDF